MIHFQVNSHNDKAPIYRLPACLFVSANIFLESSKNIEIIPSIILPNNHFFYYLGFYFK